MPFIKRFFSKTNIILYVITLGIIALDLITKHIAQSNLGVGESTTFISGLIDFTYTLNKGAAWSAFASLQNSALILGIISCIFAIGVFAFNLYLKTDKNLLYYFAFCLVLGGTLGNGFDRLFLGAVRDFIQCTFISFPIFNVADMCLVVGLCLFCLWYFIRVFKNDKDKKQNEQQNQIVKEDEDKE